MLEMSEDSYQKTIALMGRKPLNPIGQCFDSTAHQILTWSVHETDFTEIRICHGIVTCNVPGQEGQNGMHSWIEANVRGKRFAFDTTWGVMQEVPAYRAGASLIHVVEYSMDEFILLWKEAGYPGPFDPKIIEVGLKNEHR
jgi:hypothetical protein